MNFDREWNRIVSDFKQLQEENETLKSQLAGKEEVISSNEKQIQQLKQEQLETSGSLKRVEEQCASLQSSLGACHRQRDQLEESLDRTSKQLKASRQELANKEQQMYKVVNRYANDITAVVDELEFERTYFLNQCKNPQRKRTEISPLQICQLGQDNQGEESTTIQTLREELRKEKQERHRLEKELDNNGRTQADEKKKDTHPQRQGDNVVDESSILLNQTRKEYSVLKEQLKASEQKEAQLAHDLMELSTWADHAELTNQRLSRECEIAERVLVEFAESSGDSFQSTEVGKKYLNLKSLLDREMDSQSANQTETDDSNFSSANAENCLPSNDENSADTELGAKSRKKQRNC